MELIEPADDFPYLRHTITYNNSDWAVVYHNLQEGSATLGNDLKGADDYKSNGAELWYYL